MRVIETVRTSQCPRCGKPAQRCRCELKKSIRQRTKCVFSYILPKVVETEKLSSNEAPSPQSFQLFIQSPLQETTTDDTTMLAENYIICPRCIMKLKRSRESQEGDPIDNSLCQHCMLRAQIYKLKAEKRKSRLRAQHTKRTKKEDKLEIIYMSKKNQIALTESKPSCEEQEPVIKTSPKETDSDKLQTFKYSPTELNIFRASSMPIDLTKTQNMFQYETSFLTYKEDNIQMKETVTDVEKDIKFKKLISEVKLSKASSFQSSRTISNLRELKLKIQPDHTRSQLSDFCKTDQVIETAKAKLQKPAAVLRGDKLSVSESQEIMSYRFPMTPKKDTLHKRIISSELIRRTREELLNKEGKKQKEKERILARKLEREKRMKQLENSKQEQNENLERKEDLSDPSNQEDHKTGKENNKLEIDEISTKKHKENDNQEKRQKEKDVPGITSQKLNLEDEKVASKQKKDKEEAEKRRKKEEEEAGKKKKKEEDEAAKKKKKEVDEAERKKKKEEELEDKKRREEIESLKKQKAEDALKKQKAEEDRLKQEQQKISNKKEEAEAAKKEKVSPQVAKKKIEEDTAGSKKKKEDEETKKSDDKKKKEELEKKQEEDEKRSPEKRQFQTDSECMIFKLIKEHKVKRAEERTLLAEKNFIADRQKLTEIAKKKQEADKRKLEEAETGTMRQIDEQIKTRTLANKQTAAADRDEAQAGKIKKSKMTEIIIGDNIFKSKLPLPPDPLLQDLQEQTPLLFKKKTILSDPLDEFPDDKAKNVEKKRKDAITSDTKANTKNKKDSSPELKDTTDGVFRYALSDRSFIDKGWTVLPVEEVVRKMNVYRMRPAQPEFDWFERNKNKRYMQYDTGEKLAVFDDKGGCRWYYKNGRLALDYYNSEELNSQHRFVVYSNGEPDERGRSRPYTVLATFSHLGTGVVFDHGGKIRLKYNQTEGVLLDREIGPVTTWKWHSLNDPPVLRQVMINSKLSHKDQTILHLGEKDDHNIRKKDEMMIAIENENSIKEMRKKQSLDFKPFQIKTKVLKINENFSLKVLDQATIYLIFREGSANIKLNIGMLLDHHEIIDTDTAAVGVVSNCVERIPAATESIAALQRSVEHAQRFERTRTARERLLRPPPPGDSAERLVAGLSRPLKVPLRTLPASQTASKINVGSCRCSRKPTCNVYYNSRLA